MNFKQFLKENGLGNGTARFDGYGQSYELPKKKKKLPPLALLKGDNPPQPVAKTRFVFNRLP